MSKKEKNYLIYCYNVNNSVYVGLTKNLDNRHKQHLSGGSRDSIYAFCQNSGVPIPPPKILEQGLSSSEAQVKENDWISYHKDNGFNIINKAKCGYQISSLGGKGLKERDNVKKVHKSKEILTYDKCYNIAKTCSSKKDFRIKNLRYYNYAFKHGWISDYTWFEQSEVTIDNDNITFPLYEEKVKECCSLTDFCLKYKRFYIWGLKRGDKQ